MKIITTTGFYGTGSSAITDLMKEYDNVSCKSDYELRFLYDPDCVSDLEYNIIENTNRHNSSHALKRFIKQMNNLDHIWFIKRYQKYFSGYFTQAVNKYVSKLIETEYKGAWHYDVYDKGKIFYLISRFYSKINLYLHNLINIPLDGRALLPKNEKSYLTITDEKNFLNATREFVDDIAKLLNKDNKEYVLFDQLVPPSNLERYLRYVSDLKIIVVDRDPRDIFIMEKEIWNGCVVPTENVEEFCKWYLWTRNTLKSIPQNALKIQFEDMIYNYDKTISQIENFLGINRSNHVFLKQKFNPEVSKNNTQTWYLYNKYKYEIEYIKKHLADYCYNFPIQNNIKKEKMF